MVTTVQQTDVPASPETGSEEGVTAPVPPDSLRSSGLTLAQLSDFILKGLYLHGSLTGFETAAELQLPFSVVEESLQFLKDQQCVQVTRGEMTGPVSQSFVLTDLGRIRARDALEQCRYVGPAPVPLTHYVEQCRRQQPSRISITRDHLRGALENLVVSDELLNQVGPAVCSGHSLFLHGPPGNGKTVVAKAVGSLLNAHGGEIYVPYAVAVENAVVTVFDPAVHRTTDDEERRRRKLAEQDRISWENSETDRRWRRIRRPVVTVGGELTLDMLDLRHQSGGRYYTAPVHLKANGGVLLIDDFGRQQLSPRALLNRWILPLEERTDYLTLNSGKKVAVPFEQLVIFSTNLNPQDLVDDAFLRRIKHKIHMPAPSREVYGEILRNCCRRRGFAFDERHVDALFERRYNRHRSPRASDPQDLLETVDAICRFRNEEPHLDDALLAAAAERFFCDV